MRRAELAEASADAACARPGARRGMQGGTGTTALASDTSMAHKAKWMEPHERHPRADGCATQPHDNKWKTGRGNRNGKEERPTHPPKSLRSREGQTLKGRDSPRRGERHATGHGLGRFLTIPTYWSYRMDSAFSRLREIPCLFNSKYVTNKGRKRNRPPPSASSVEEGSAREIASKRGAQVERGVGHRSNI